MAAQVAFEQELEDSFQGKAAAAAAGKTNFEYVRMQPIADYDRRRLGAITALRAAAPPPAPRTAPAHGATAESEDEVEQPEDGDDEEGLFGGAGIYSLPLCHLEEMARIASSLPGII